MRIIKSNIPEIVGTIIGMISGFLYWKFIGCSSGTCAITSDPINSTIYGAALGGLLVSIFTEYKKGKA